MLYVKEISNDHKHVKVIYSLERSDIEFVFEYETVMNSIIRGNKYKTVFTINDKLKEGSSITYVESFVDHDGKMHSGYLMTIKDAIVENNLSELPRFES